MPEWLKGTDCKSVDYVYGGSNPPPSTIIERNIMPSSSNNFDEVLLADLRKIQHSSLLDVGCGMGVYSEIIKNVFPDETIEMHAVEPTEKYITEYNLKEKYDVVFNETIQDFTKKVEKIYDVILCSDVLEHLYLSEAIDTIDCLTYNCRHLIMMWPTGQNQGWYEGNYFEKHKCNISLIDLKRFDIRHYKNELLDPPTYIPVYHYALIKGIHR